MIFAVIELGADVLIGRGGLVINEKVNSASPSVVGHPGEAPARCELHQVGVCWGSWLCLQRHAFPGVVVLRLEIEKENYPKFCIGFKIRKSRSEQLLLSGSGHSK